MPPSVNYGEWSVHGGGALLEYTLSRTYQFQGTQRPDTITTLRINCTLAGSRDANWIRTVLRLHLSPFRLAHNKTFVMGLFTAESKGGLVEVLAIPNEWDESAELEIGLCIDEDDVPKCLRAISSGKEMTFMLIEQAEPEPPPERSFVKLPPNPLVVLPLRNDSDFKQLYDELYERIAVGQDATRARQLGEGWYRKRSWDVG